MKKVILVVMILGIGLFFGACEKPKETLETTQKQEILDNLGILMNNGEKLIVNQKNTQDKTQNFKNIEPKKVNVLRDLLVTTNKKNIKMLFFFTTWCEPCIAILAHLENLQKQFGEEISIYGIAIDDLVGEVENLQQSIEVFIQENQYSLPLAYGENRDKLFEALEGIEGIPLIVLYDEKGEYIIHYLGAIPEEMMEFDLSQSVAKMRAK
ncbi:TlpA disulfide reductase family protein [Helicobacter sp.]|uniref:TlpA family protein disulfide reductase n=1 Tax=Helicobacter sp. TaxID=218 RepID=UPI0025828F43|nr:TlpA disulfide reductase family protein [Helicobacter sp.]MCI7047911.1 TlpA family protein disulfide reductase [Helicobacter sp.]